MSSFYSQTANSGNDSETLIKLHTSYYKISGVNEKTFLLDLGCVTTRALEALTSPALGKKNTLGFQVHIKFHILKNPLGSPH